MGDDLHTVLIKQHPNSAAVGRGSTPPSPTIL